MKFVYFFGAGKSEGNGSMKELLGGKGAGLAEMRHLGIPVPAGFTVTTDRPGRGGLRHAVFLGRLQQSKKTGKHAS